jgi:hypothetical protein
MSKARATTMAEAEVDASVKETFVLSDLFFSIGILFTYKTVGHWVTRQMTHGSGFHSFFPKHKSLGVLEKLLT